MSWYLDVADQCWIAPDAERVVRKSTRADELAVMFAPLNARHLRAGVDAVRPGAGGGVPEVNVTIV